MYVRAGGDIAVLIGVKAEFEIQIPGQKIVEKGIEIKEKVQEKATELVNDIKDLPNNLKRQAEEAQRKIAETKKEMKRL